MSSGTTTHIVEKISIQIPATVNGSSGRVSYVLGRDGPEEVSVDVRWKISGRPDAVRLQSGKASPRSSWAERLLIWPRCVGHDARSEVPDKEGGP